MRTITCLNIRQGGGTRQRALADWLIGTCSDLFVLTEWRRSSTEIRAALEQAGFNRTEAIRDGKPDNGVAVFSRAEHTGTRVTPREAMRGELLLVDVQGIRILGAYFPQRQAKATYFTYCAESASKDVGPLLLIGDLNTGCNERDIESGGAPFHCEDQFIELSEIRGLTDLWRAQRGDEARDWTWRSPKNGFRIDHAFGNSAFVDAYPNATCRIDHAPREMGLSDHSAVVVELNEVARPMV
ncbi:endonuclease/exonuclease/phosphatase family protein [Dokdonella immobilis]|uniref:Exonuclease III n=1 Tax=Dokdonella immobilis TaxID=578942 RepID=A0A1I4ZUS8_9GAMM|nr:endonuclease/exonuclease/phosphatase family protein [Dokdonella immobilis]SFN53994.1 Exonuclease III [Dokdonella immobilis]